MAMDQAETFEWLRQRSNRLNEVERENADLQQQVERLTMELAESRSPAVSKGMDRFYQRQIEILQEQVKRLEARLEKYEPRTV